MAEVRNYLLQNDVCKDTVEILIKNGFNSLKLLSMIDQMTDDDWMLLKLPLAQKLLVRSLCADLQKIVRVQPQVESRPNMVTSQSSSESRASSSSTSQCHQCGNIQSCCAYANIPGSQDIYSPASYITDDGDQNYEGSRTYSPASCMTDDGDQNTEASHYYDEIGDEDDDYQIPPPSAAADLEEIKEKFMFRINTVMFDTMTQPVSLPKTKRRLLTRKFRQVSMPTPTTEQPLLVRQMSMPPQARAAKALTLM